MCFFSTCRNRTPASSRPIRRRRQRPFSTAMFRPSPSSAARLLGHLLHRGRSRPSIDGSARRAASLKLQAQLAAVKLLIVDELGYVPLSQTGAELLFEIFSQRHERGSTIVTSNLPFEEWTSVFGNQRLIPSLDDHDR